MSDIVTKFKTVAERIGRTKDLGAVTAETRIAALGLDSLDLMEIIGVLENDLGVTLADEKLAKLETVGDVVAALGG